jgi:site-specific DNA recombinase
MTERAPTKTQRLRCAIYTRKSTEEGLEQEFNSLDAQREAGEAFIQSQKHLGWECSAARYDDGGFSGANMERPALTRLLGEIDAGQIDVVVVYKVDRLSRSLLDFARLIEAFEKRSVSFVSVTQQFNTAQSLGRLVLNILLSFAQFEREMIAERTRDKMGAARRKGKWVGGSPPFGYDVAPGGKRLAANQEEAERLREIFGLYAQERSLLRVVEILNGRGWVTKSWQTRDGRHHAGGPWSKSSLRKVLANVTYIGKVNYHGEEYAGEHEGIVAPDLFAKVQAMLATARRDNRGSPRNKYGFLLRGLVRCTTCGSVMTSSTSSPRGRTYRYYCCTEVNRRGRAQCEVRSVPAEELEQFVVARIREMGADSKLAAETAAAVEADRTGDAPQLAREERLLHAEHAACRGEAKHLVAALAGSESAGSRFVVGRLAEVDDRAGVIESRLAEIRATLTAIDRTDVDPSDVTAKLALFDPIWTQLTPREQSRVLHILIKSIEYDGNAHEVGITLKPSGIAGLDAGVTIAALPSGAAA